jgi:4'-phosphopantetheinyl transferase
LAGSDAIIGLALERFGMFGGSGQSGRWSVRRDDAECELGVDSVHVWRVHLDRTEGATRALSDLLTPDERARAARFRFPVDQARFTVARGALRKILARYGEVAAEGLRFRTNEYGKPALGGGTDLRFNLSHAHAIALVAVACGRDVGIDVELVRSDVETLQIAGHYFSSNEVATLAALPSELTVRGFYTCWTRKEAYIKAIGKGLSQALDSFDVSLEPGSPAALLACRDDPSEVHRWSMQALHPGPGYVGALAVEGTGWRLDLRDFGEVTTDSRGAKPAHAEERSRQS